MATPQETTRILRRLLASGINSRAERLLMRVHPADLGPLISGLSPPELRTVIDLLFRHRRAARALIELPPEMLPSVFDALGDERLALVLGRLELDDMVQLVEWIPEDRREDILARLPDEKRAELRKAELYPDDSAGRVMTTSFVALQGIGLEGANLEHNQRFADRFRAAGDEDGARVLERIERDEVAHVAFAATWFERLTGAALNYDTWSAALPAPLTPSLLQGQPLNRDARLRAGLDEVFLARLEAEPSTSARRAT